MTDKHEPEHGPRHEADKHPAEKHETAQERMDRLEKERREHEHAKAKAVATPRRPMTLGLQQKVGRAVLQRQAGAPGPVPTEELGRVAIEAYEAGEDEPAPTPS